MPDVPIPSPPTPSWMPEPSPRPKNPWLRMLASLAARIQVGQCTLVMPGGRRLSAEGSRERWLRTVVEIHRARAARRLMLRGTVGFAEAYMDGDWSCRDLPAFLELALRNETAIGERAEGLGLMRWIHRLAHRLRANNRRGSRRNISRHYDLGNEFYGLWLDRDMTYSSALFAAKDEPLAAAQDRKYRQLADMLALQPGQHVLEIGCGWGRFAEIAAGEYGCRVTALTLSRAQAAHARRRILAAGLTDRVNVRLQDYRDVSGQFDRIAAIEMFEAVGEDYWQGFFDVLRERLAPGGIAAMQVITIDDSRFERYRRGADFVQSYIFPGGMLPSPAVLVDHVRRAGLALDRWVSFGNSYALTLQRWQRRFQEAWPLIRTQGFDDRFKRMWEYYLAYCEAGFRAGAIDVCQMRIERPA